MIVSTNCLASSPRLHTAKMAAKKRRKWLISCASTTKLVCAREKKKFNSLTAPQSREETYLGDLSLMDARGGRIWPSDSERLELATCCRAVCKPTGCSQSGRPSCRRREELGGGGGGVSCSDRVILVNSSKVSSCELIRRKKVFAAHSV